jgi:SecD/SecF fusion protein
MRHLYRNLAICVIVIGFLAWQIFPVEQKLRLGKDLRGGVTLVYPVQIDRADDPGDVLDRTIAVLKNRVDPTGTLDIQMVAQGQDRIEITMPLPREAVKRQRAEFQARLDALGSGVVAPAALDAALRMPSAEREAELTRLAAGREGMLASMRAAATALDGSAAARMALDLAAQRGDADEVLNDLADKAGEAEVAYERARGAVLAASIDPEVVRRALELPRERTRLKSEATGERVELPSLHERAIEELTAAHPEQAGAIREVVGLFDAYRANRDSLDDPSDLKRLLASSGQLTFRITCDPMGAGSSAMVHPEEQRLREELREKGPRNVRARDARWFKINDPLAAMNIDTVEAADAFFAAPAAVGASRGYVVEEWGGEYFMLAWDTRALRLTQADGAWGLRQGFVTTDDLGKPAIGFTMDPQGAVRLGDLTGTNVNNRMAVLLDDQVYTAPNINSRITRSGIIQGDYSASELDYVIRILNAGSLQARLSPEPLSEVTVAPELGADNLRLGLAAGVLSFAVVGVVIVLYYFQFGLIALIALAANGLIILGAMSVLRSAFTMPGIAGVVLTFGMAVDANVLIYERVREEIRRGLELRSAVKLGFQKAFSSIVDGNVTNLIVCLVLYQVGTPELKGFAVTMSIGVVATLFAGLFVTRVIFALLIEKVGLRKGWSMLPMQLPVIDRVLEPKIDWIRYRWVAVAVSTLLVGTGLVMIFSRGEKMLDTEFRGGTQVTVQFRPVDAGDPDGPRVTGTRREVEEAIQAIGRGRSETDPLSTMRVAEILPLDPQADGVTSDRFQIKTLATESRLVLDAVIEALGDRIDALPALTFAGDESGDLTATAPVFPITQAQLGANIGEPGVVEDVSGFIGGVAIVLRELNPPPTLAQLDRRVAQLRASPSYSDTLGRPHRTIVVEGTPERVGTAVVVSADEGLSILDNEEAWRADVAGREWRLVHDALTEVTTLASVQSFSPAVAADFRAKAFVSIALSCVLMVIYIWIRFGNAWYSLAAIACLAHDALTAVGLIALAEIIYDAHVFEGVAASLGILPFKIDLNLIAAVLTIIGYSVNDTIVIMDRIRENRGKLPYASRRVVNDAINQTFSRTVMTSGTTLVAILILYIEGGEGMRSFAYAMLIGVAVGTYSTVAVAAPLVWSKKADQTEARERKRLEALHSQSDGGGSPPAA